MKKLNLFTFQKQMFFAALILTASFSVNANVNDQSKSVNNISDGVNSLTEEILKETENALSLVKTQPESSLTHVKNALLLVKSLKNQLSSDTHVKNKSPLIVNNTKEYWFIYPSVGKKIIKNKADFPTIYSKFNSGILYQGSKPQSGENLNAYFDYAFAHASLLTAREALVANNDREAISSLKWVFEAIYISPDFYVAEANDAYLMEKLFNLKGDFPIVSLNNH